MSRDLDTVEWTLSAGNNVKGLQSVLGAEVARSIDFLENHHGALAQDAARTTGVVVAIHAVRSRFASSPEEPKTWRPLPGSGQLTVTHSADGWDPNTDGLWLSGYLVDLEVPGPGR
jgi:hypothetical protein